MNQLETIQLMNTIYPLMHPLKECSDTYCPCDAYNNIYLVEVKNRRQEFNDWIMEKKKFDACMKKAKEEGKQFIYLTEYDKEIITWNITFMDTNGHNWNWSSDLKMNKTTDFEDNNKVNKEVTYLQRQDGITHTLSEYDRFKYYD